jgi:hypothetical protein
VQSPTAARAAVVTASAPAVCVAGACRTTYRRILPPPGPGACVRCGDIAASTTLRGVAVGEGFPEGLDLSRAPSHAHPSADTA